MRTRVIGLTGRCGLKHVRICMLIAAATLAVAACEQGDVTSPSRPDATGEMLVEAFGGSEPVASDLADVVATVDLAHGGVVTFLDLGDGHIGIAERTPRPAQPVSRSMIENLNATPLEVFLALRPRNAGVPDRLLRDHQMRVAQSRETTGAPRALAAPRPTGSELTDPSRGLHECDVDEAWVGDWINAFAGITKYRSADYRYDLSGTDTYTFYPGAHVYHGTNTNSKTYLGACRGPAQDGSTLQIVVHRRISGSWVEVYYASLEPQETFTFYGGVPASFRARVFVWPTSFVPSYGIGAAWTLSPPIKTP